MTGRMSGSAAVSEKSKFLILISVFVMLLFIGCSRSEPNKKLYIYNWSEYMPDEVIAEFEKETGIDVVYDVYSSNEEMYAKIKAGGGGYDIAFPSADYAKIMINEGMLQKMDRSKLDNLKYLDPEFLAKLTFDPGHDYAVPYAMGAVGIAVNTKYVNDFPRSFDIFKMEKYKNRMTLLDDMREVLSSALLIHGYPQGSTDPVALQKAKEEVLSWKKNILRFDSEGFGKAFASEEYWIVHGYAENINSELTDEQKKHFVYFIPRKGAMMSIDSMVILKDARNVEAAHRFMNYVMRPEVYVKVVEYFNMPSINVEARKLKSMPDLYPVEDLKRATMLEDIGDAVQVHNKIWEEIKLARP